jgi:hypothetical protein
MSLAKFGWRCPFARLFTPTTLVTAGRVNRVSADLTDFRSLPGDVFGVRYRDVPGTDSVQRDLMFCTVPVSMRDLSHSPDTDYFGLLRPLVASALRNTHLGSYRRLRDAEFIGSKSP